ncbi:InlB B-repeat-containing protein, partial [Enterocloster asparagiformis]|uniref:InlB B-repeat-containing protein n=1 Tax=Enterocloster asparagiformis TaxID=333367 RepID=UPI002A813BE9
MRNSFLERENYTKRTLNLTGGGIDSELRIFVRLPEDADDMYMVTGDEEILFLYINNGDGTIRCSTNITRTVDGEEKVKKTKSVTIRSYESAFGDEEVNIIPDQPKQDVNEATSSTADKENTNSNNSNQTNENTTPAENQGAGDAAQDGIDKENAAAPDQNVTDGGNDAQAPQEDIAAPDGEAQTPDAGNQEENAPEADAADQAAEPEGDAAEPDAADVPEEAAEPEGDTAEPEEAAEPIASVIRHYAPVVADNENGEAAPADDSQKEQVADVPDSADQAEAPNEDAAVEEPKAEEPKADEPKADEPAADAPAAGNTVTTPDENAADGAVTTPDENGTGDAATTPDENGTGDAATTPNENGTGDATTPQEPTDGTQAPTPDTPAAGEDQNNGQPAGTPDVDQPQAPEEELPKESVVTVIPPATPSEGTQQKPEDNVSAANTSDLVGMGYCSTAKAYSVTLNQLKALDDFEGYKVTYDIAPKASARIVDGPRGVEEGGTLVFGVKNQIGYAIEAVAVNGETLETDSVTDNDDGAQTAWYTVPEVYEEQEVVVTMTESGEHPEFSATLPMSDGTIIHLYAEEGVLPAGVKAEASVVTGIEDVVKANVEAEAEAAGEQKEVVASLSYNIDLLDKDGHKLDDQIWSGSVQVTFTGAPIEEKSKEADVVEVMYVATTKEDEAQAKVTADDVVAVEAAAEPVEVFGEESVEAVTFEAEHFSVYTVTFTNWWDFKQIIKIKVVDANGNDIGYNDNATYTLYNGDYTKISSIASDVKSNMGLSGYTFTKATIEKNINNTAIGSFERDGSNIYAYSGNKGSGQKLGKITENSNIYFWFTADNVTITFKPNGATGIVPATIKTSPGKQVILPGHNTLKKSGYSFIGWSTDPNRNISIAGHSSTLYPTDSIYEMPNNTKNVDLYAIWGKNNEKATFYVATFGGDDIPQEPGSHSVGKYTSGIEINGALKVAQFVADTSGIKVEANLAKQPTEYQIRQKCVASKLTYNTGRILADGTPDPLDPKNGYKVVWYVIKNESSWSYGSLIESWHVDGVIIPIENIILQYDANCAEFTGKIPDSSHGKKDSLFTVASQGDLARDGWTFGGWNTQRDGNGDDYKPGQKITIAEDTTLYAKWIPDESITKEISYTVQHWIEGEKEPFKSHDEVLKVWKFANDELPVTASSIAPIAPMGYEFSRYEPEDIKAGDIVKDDSVIKVFYSRKTNLTYTVEYYKDNTTDEKNLLGT